MPALDLRFAQANLVAEIPLVACHTETGTTGSTTFRGAEGAYGLAVAERKGGCLKAVYVTAGESLFAFDACGATVANTLRTPIGANAFIRDVTVNRSCDGFEISNGDITGRARQIVSYTAGVIAGANPAVNPLFIVFDGYQHPLPEDFTSVAYFDKHVYAVGRAAGQVFKIDSGWALVDTFTDAGLVDAGYHPLGVRVVRVRGKCRLAVTFTALQPPSSEEQIYAGDGYVDMFRPDGSFYRFANRGALSLPFAAFNVCVGGANFVGVSNRGDGRINFFDERGRLVSPALDAYGNVVSIRGLAGVAPDPRKAVLYFAASNAPERGTSPREDGLFGSLTLVA